MAQYVNEGGVWWEIHSDGTRRCLDDDDDAPPDSSDFQDVDDYIEAHDRWRIGEYTRLLGGEVEDVHTDNPKEKTVPVYTPQGRSWGDSSHGGYSTTNYSSTALLDGLDVKKWRRTYFFLLRFQFSDSYYKDIKYVYGDTKPVPKYDGDWRKSRWNAQKGCWESNETPASAQSSMAPYYEE